MGAGTLLLSVLCFVAPARLFGVDAYRTLTGVPIGLLGAVTFGLAASALAAATGANIHVMRSTAMNMFLAAALIPPVITYNIGAFDAISTSGVRALSLSVTFIAGVSLPHSSSMQSTMGTPVSESQLEPGDLVFFYSPVSHVAMYIGNGQMVHASTAGQPVKVASVASMPGYNSARRIAG